MYVMLENSNDIDKAQRQLRATLKAQSDGVVTKALGYEVGARPVHSFQSQWWYWTSEGNKGGPSGARRFNWFGAYNEAAAVNITVEMNIAYLSAAKEPGRRRPNAFFAKDIRSGQIYLFHTGVFGGSKAGISRLGFLAHSGLKPKVVLRAEGKQIHGIMVMPIQGQSASRTCFNYVRAAADYKAAARAGKLKSARFKKQVSRWRDYFIEAGGSRKFFVGGMVEYNSRHWEVVHALKLWRDKKGFTKGQTVVKDRFVDLAVAKGETLIEAYEVKTSCDRTDIYCAIGQLMVHSRADDDCKRILVLPIHANPFDGLAPVLNALDISLIRYRFEIDSVRLPVK
ncbi:hypothetical protein [Stenotrophomonas rhizophila]|uniref:Protein NO VEIN C-terminal domain-containing protein n=1 Tax=Stenotrophomonas rhizophila TaxID=216778 RepID=A0AAW5PMQ1_9GAMM|nr:hypothetical protein [Stenotrophomonas rhizophila]MCS4281711.1 hypothetical protein [Stenotrophomonas rhizophila]